jgi:hypothetical protein
MITGGRGTFATRFPDGTTGLTFQPFAEDYEPAFMVKHTGLGMTVGFGTVNLIEAKYNGIRIGGYNADGTTYEQPKIGFPAPGQYIYVKVIVDESAKQNIKDVVILTGAKVDITDGEYPLAYFYTQQDITQTGLGFEEGKAAGRYLQIAHFHLRYQLRGGKKYLYPTNGYGGWAIKE